MKQTLTVLGATGSIGQSTLDVVARHPDRFTVYALTGASQWQRLADQCRQFKPRYAVLADPIHAASLREALAGTDTEVLSGEDALAQVASAHEVDTVMAAIVGAAGLLPNLAAARAGKKILLANKESLVMAGDLFMRAVQEQGAQLLPIDSEHNAIFQCLPPGFTDTAHAGVSSIVLTASGGPFRGWGRAALDAVTPDQACAHPNWSMGRKISVDSASLMNKGLELIEACWLFGLRPDQVEVVVHPQSIIHSMVRYQDGSVLAQMGNPDMRTPIAHALAWPERIGSGVADLDFLTLGSLDFEAPDLDAFPCLALAFEAAKGGSASTCLNAANEVAVDAFLDQRLGFNDIARLNADVMTRLAGPVARSVEEVLAQDQEARALANQWLRHGNLSGSKSL
ncbi:1-deoxy-D-xylulose-5-phosphate reductoisomerase [Simiduia agarivorans]|uniref:1-deoxy-D-xylulose 5-phosphate reductoisomerase n=1 Tax=Simiduia agarivorans (strain DSM 21679 / JCM 13881 / BCRC 17597 / SA1) TaxID=1117647 RepID=K4KGP1_SIMAS|nr:1-deoxy-D-xylulose-5-phosphate reductoisomerase [Simiduia agarivorans]AFU98264.1 1-deoxy-D-xylulose 5-phosphate reductoisomerase [Simiduia agarivorans SA1 = DSM 21679]